MSAVVELARKAIVAMILFFFFFQAEDGIRDSEVTGVQTCALPISVVAVSLDRKSTRLNSSHPRISYAVFCLEKQTQITATKLDYLRVITMSRALNISTDF